MPTSQYVKKVTPQQARRPIEVKGTDGRVRGHLFPDEDHLFEPLPEEKKETDK